MEALAPEAGSLPPADTSRITPLRRRQNTRRALTVGALTKLCTQRSAARAGILGQRFRRECSLARPPAQFSSAHSRSRSAGFDLVDDYRCKIVACLLPMRR